MQHHHDNDQFSRSVIILRDILGSIERMIAILIEVCDRKWPFQLSPRQVMIIPVKGSQSLMQRKFMINCISQDLKQNWRILSRFWGRGQEQEGDVTLQLYYNCWSQGVRVKHSLCQGERRQSQAQINADR
ncbi:unnamed protein product [Paramecium octaurelia]|uniref:Uncharacterized protein n=1 Tax=Paramecium octaurelia TaxID=43137 RepID=A0A8S1UKI4_PAROT|nr:unnamed protein product [Paramecium octaurelia]